MVTGANQDHCTKRQNDHCSMHLWSPIITVPDVGFYAKEYHATLFTQAKKYALDSAARFFVENKRGTTVATL